MLERLRVENFQLHADQELTLDPQITTIVGPSDSGKSSLMRAVRWLALNRPRGTGFQRHGTDMMRVRLKIDDGQQVTRERKGSSNLYKVGKASFEAFGNDVPPAVEQLLGLTEYNFQGQHDPPFWFGLTGGELAKELNAIADLSLVDEALGYIAKRARALNTEKDVTGKRLEDAKAAKASLSHVRALDQQLGELEAVEVDMGKLAVVEYGLATTLSRAKEEKLQADRYTQAATAARAVVVSGERVQAIVREGRELKDLAQRLTAAATAAARRPDISKVAAAKDRWQQLRDSIVGLAELVDDTRDQQRVYEEAQSKADSLRQQLARETQGRCPICGGKYEAKR